MWKWTITFDKAFDIPTYRVNFDGFIRNDQEVWRRMEPGGDAGAASGAGLVKGYATEDNSAATLAKAIATASPRA